MYLRCSLQHKPQVTTCNNLASWQRVLHRSAASCENDCYNHEHIMSVWSLLEWLQLIIGKKKIAQKCLILLPCYHYNLAFSYNGTIKSIYPFSNSLSYEAEAQIQLIVWIHISLIGEEESFSYLMQLINHLWTPQVSLSTDSYFLHSKPLQLLWNKK